jgi:hypothetical protein
VLDGSQGPLHSQVLSRALMRREGAWGEHGAHGGDEQTGRRTAGAQADVYMTSHGLLLQRGRAPHSGGDPSSQSEKVSDVAVQGALRVTQMMVRGGEETSGQETAGVRKRQRGSCLMR